MPQRSRTPVFLGRHSYRRRRWRDAARLLPVLGFVLLLVPLMWPRGQVGNATALIYIFAVWAGLVLAAFVLGRHIRSGAEGDDTGDQD